MSLLAFLLLWTTALAAILLWHSETRSHLATRRAIEHLARSMRCTCGKVVAACIHPASVRVDGWEHRPDQPCRPAREAL